ncbi:hypothetical protein K523DRAFT_189545, partial [Schizophyllum commune Tattone D]
PPISRTSNVNSHVGSTATPNARLKGPHSAAMFNNSALRYNGYIGDGVYIEDSPPPQETMFGVSDRPWSQSAREFEPFRHGFDRSPVTQDNRLGSGGHRLGYAQQLPPHAPVLSVNAINPLDDILIFGHDQHNATTIRPEHLQHDPAIARASEHASSTAHNSPSKLDARLPATDPDTLAPWNPQHAAPDAPNAEMYFEPLQAPRYGDHSAGRPMQQAIEFARQPEPGGYFGDTLACSTDVTSASVSSDFPLAHPTWSMPSKAELFNEFATQLSAPRLPYSHSVPAASSPFRTPYDSPTSSSDF